MLTSKLLTTLNGYTREQFISYASAGISVGFVALPPAMAFAIAGGLHELRQLHRDCRKERS